MASTITDVITNEVSDDGGVARVVLRDAKLDFTDKISTDVSSLSEDSTAELGKHGDK